MTLLRASSSRMGALIRLGTRAPEAGVVAAAGGALLEPRQSFDDATVLLLRAHGDAQALRHPHETHRAHDDAHLQERLEIFLGLAPSLAVDEVGDGRRRAQSQPR